jgi:glycine/D-amino acid oxidase-like deaminating enzyme
VTDRQRIFNVVAVGAGVVGRAAAPALLVSTPAGAPPLVRRIVYTSDAAQLHLRATTGGGLLLGADDGRGRVTEDDSPEGVGKAASAPLQRARRIIPEFGGAAPVDRCRLGIGVRAVPADGKCIPGPMPAAEGLHIVFAHGGMTPAPALGELIADSIERGAVPPQLVAFGLERFEAMA